MKTSTISLVILSLVLVSGCSLPNPTLETDRPVLSELEVAENYLANPRMSPVLFQFATINETSGAMSGYLIDRYGHIRTYELAEAPNEFLQYRNNYLDKTSLQTLLDVSVASGETIELTELVRRVRIYHRSSDQELDQRDGNELANETVTFYAYAAANAEASASSNCNSSSHTSSQLDENTVRQLPLYSQGKVNLTNESAYVEEMVQWLTTLIPALEVK